MHHTSNAHHFDVSKCIVSNIQLYVSNIKRMFPIYRLCFQTPFHVSNIQFLFPISNLCFQLKIMFPNDNVSNVCFQSTYYRFGTLKSISTSNSTKYPSTRILNDIQFDNFIFERKNNSTARENFWSGNYIWLSKRKRH